MKKKIWLVAFLSAAMLAGLPVTASAAEKDGKKTDPVPAADETPEAEETPDAEKTPEAEETPDGWQISGKKRYYYQDGKPVTGEAEIDGTVYLFAPNGVQQKGWQTVGGKRCFYDGDGNAVTGWINWRGEDYFVSAEEGKLKAELFDIDGKSCLFDDHGVLLRGWQKTEAGWRYDGVKGETLIDDIPYLFDENGLLLTGWQTASDKKTRYYDAETHEIRTGWIEEDGVRGYADPETGLRVTGGTVIGDTRYVFSEDGVMLTGIRTFSDGSVRYFGEDGKEQTGLIKLEDGTYLFTVGSGMYKGLFEYQGTVRSFDENGRMQTGIVESEDGLRIFNAETGMLERGAVTFDGADYFADADGIVVINSWIGKSWYGADGKRITGWLETDGKQYYFDENGTLCTGAVKVGERMMLFDSEGVLSTGWQTVNGKTYYAKEDGTAVTGWQEIGDYGYYFYEDASMAVSTTVEEFSIGADGHARTQLAIVADNLVATTQKTPFSIYSLCVGRYRYSKIEATRTYSQLSAQGWDKLVNYTVYNYRGVCYYLAATMDYFLQRAGYTTRLVHATHETGNHYWNQVLINGVWQNYDPTYGNRGNLPWNTQIALGNYQVLGFVTVHYDKRGAYLGDSYSTSY